MLLNLLAPIYLHNCTTELLPFKAKDWACYFPFFLSDKVLSSSLTRFFFYSNLPKTREREMKTKRDEILSSSSLSADVLWFDWLRLGRGVMDWCMGVLFVVNGGGGAWGRR